MTEQKRPRDRPLAECARVASRLIAAGGHIQQKFTCDGCGARLTVETPDVFFKTGTCDRCLTVTDIAAKGCGYILHGVLTPELAAAIRQSRGPGGHTK